MSISYEQVTKATNYSTSYKFEDNRDLSGWTLRIQLRNKNTFAIANGIDRVVADTIENNTVFVVNLTPTELDIDEGHYVLAAELNNAATEERVEKLTYIEITKEWVV